LWAIACSLKILSLAGFAHWVPMMCRFNLGGYILMEIFVPQVAKLYIEHEEIFGVQKWYETPLLPYQVW